MNVDAKEMEGACVFVNSLPDQNYDSKKRDALSYNSIRRISCRARVSFQMFFACTILASKCQWKKPKFYDWARSRHKRTTNEVILVIIFLSTIDDICRKVQIGESWIGIFIKHRIMMRPTDLLFKGLCADSISSFGF